MLGSTNSIQNLKFNSVKKARRLRGTRICRQWGGANQFYVASGEFLEQGFLGAAEIFLGNSSLPSTEVRSLSTVSYSLRARRDNTTISIARAGHRRACPEPYFVRGLFLCFSNSKLINCVFKLSYFYNFGKNLITQNF